MDSRRAFLLSGYLAGELSPQEREELDLVCLADPEFKKTLLALDALHEGVPAGLSASDEKQALERGLSDLRSVMYGNEVVVLPEKRSLIRRMPLWSRIAAACILGFIVYRAGMGWLVVGNAERPGVRQSRFEFATIYGTRNIIVLPDSSRLWLNAGSKVEYGPEFTEGRRELRLEGEAYLDIKSDPGHPFIIHTGKVDVRVLGTTLNVKAYPGDSAVETTLIKGKVQIEYGEQHVLLQPSEKLTIALKGQEKAANVKAPQHSVVRQTVRPDSVFKTLIETSWVEDKLAFRNEPFEKVAEKLERWYNIRIHFQNDQYRQVSMSGNFKDKPIATVMDALKISLGFHYRIEGDSISVW